MVFFLFIFSLCFENNLDLSDFLAKITCFKLNDSFLIELIWSFDKIFDHDVFREIFISKEFLMEKELSWLDFFQCIILFIFWMFFFLCYFQLCFLTIRFINLFSFINRLNFGKHLWLVSHIFVRLNSLYIIQFYIM